MSSYQGFKKLFPIVLQEKLNFKPNLSLSFLASLYFKTALYFTEKVEKENNNSSLKDETIYHSYRNTPPSITAVSLYFIKQNKN